jgi:uncharacterized membrane protein
LAKVAYVYCQKFLLSLLHLLMHQMGEIIIWFLKEKRWNDLSFHFKYSKVIHSTS